MKKFKVLIALFLIAFVGTWLYNVNNRKIAKPETSVVDNRNEIKYDNYSLRYIYKIT